MGNVSNVAKRHKVLDIIRRFSSKNAEKYQTEEVNDHSSFSASRSSDYEDVCTSGSSENTSNASLQFDEAIWLFTDSEQESANTEATQGSETPAPNTDNDYLASTPAESYREGASTSAPAHIHKYASISRADSKLALTTKTSGATISICTDSSPLRGAAQEAEAAESLACAISEPVADLKNMFDTVLIMDTDATEENCGLATGMSDASDSRNGPSIEAAAKRGAGDQPLSPNSATRSRSFTSRQCSAQAELSSDMTGSPAAATAAALAGERVQELDAVAKRIARFEEFCYGFSSALNSVLSMYEHVVERDTFAITTLKYKEKLLFPCDIEYAFRGGSPVKIGSGEFGDVFVGRLVPDRRFVAIKALKKDRTDLLSLLQEAFIMQLASSTEFAAQYHGLIPIGPLGTSYQKLGLVCEFIGDTQSLQPSDFRHALKDLQSRQVIDRTAQLMWLDVCLKMAKAIAAFHDMGILLNDIKTDNILLRHCGPGSLEPVFIDFGLASVGEGITLAIDLETQTKEELMKEYSHIAPEVLFGGHSNAISDVYSFGKVLTQISEPLKVPTLQALAEECVDMEPSTRATCRVILDAISFTYRESLRLSQHKPIWQNRPVIEEYRR